MILGKCSLCNYINESETAICSHINGCPLMMKLESTTENTVECAVGSTVSNIQQNEEDGNLELKIVS